MPSVLLVIAPEMFRDEEYAHPREALERRGATVVTASTRPGTCTGRFGLVASADLALAVADAHGYAAVAFIGGGGSQVLFDDGTAHALARAAAQAGAVVGAICIAPSVLARAGLLEGRRATAFPSQEDDLTSHGALWTGEPVEVDGRIVTANGPDAARAFGDAIADLLGLPR